MRIGLYVIMGIAVATTALDGESEQFKSIQESIVTQLAASRVPSLAVGVARGNQILWEHGFGWANREKRISADENTMYSLASISKPLTATALMILVEDGKINLDRPINGYLGAGKLESFEWDLNQATVRRVASHTAGLPEYFQFFYANEAAQPQSPDETIRRFAKIIYPPGEHYQYSNLGYGLLSYVISRVSGMSYADYMRKNVFLKLGMTHTSVYIPRELTKFEAARYDGEDYVPIVDYKVDHDGASAIYSSVHDLIRFAQFQLKAHLSDQFPIISDSTIDEMHEPAGRGKTSGSYGLGWEISNLSGYTVIGHSGGMPGVATWLRLIPSENLAIAVLSNANDRLAHSVMDQIMASLLPGYIAPSAQVEEKRPPLAPSQTLTGNWTGTIRTYSAQIPIVLRFLRSGQVLARIGKHAEVAASNPRLTQEGYFRCRIAGSLPLDEAKRRPSYLTVDLRVSKENAMAGAISDRADEPGTMFISGSNGRPTTQIEKEAFILTQWCELKKLEEK